jgi:hypothetical protein
MIAHSLRLLLFLHAVSHLRSLRGLLCLGGLSQGGHIMFLFLRSYIPNEQWVRGVEKLPWVWADQFNIRYTLSRLPKS